MQHSVNAFCAAFIFLSVFGCSNRSIQPESIHGTWVVDPDDVTENLDQLARTMRRQNTPEQQIASWREQMVEIYDGHAWMIHADGTYKKIKGSSPTFGKYRIYQSGVNHIILRLMPDDSLNDAEIGFDFEKLNDLSAKQLAKELGMGNGPLPFHNGFEHINENQIRGYSLELDEDLRITQKRTYGYLYNRQ